METNNKSLTNDEVKHFCVYCKGKIEYPEATLIIRNRKESTLTIWEFCNTDCLDDFVKNIGRILSDVEERFFEKINNPTQNEFEKIKMKGGSKNDN